MEASAKPPDMPLRRIAAGLGLFTVVVWGAGGVIFGLGPLPGLGWMLNRDVTLVSGNDPQTAAYKSAQERFRDIDFAIARAMTNLQIGPDQVRESRPRVSAIDDKPQPVERILRVSDFYATSQSNLEIDRSVSEVGGRIISAVEASRSKQLSLQVGFGQTVTHRLTLIPDETIFHKVGHMAIVINDLEVSRTDVATQFIGIDRPLTFSINPWRGAGRKWGVSVAERDQEVLVNLPMEPVNYPRISPGRPAILVNQSVAENRRVVREAISVLPMAGGFKNFMGGRATAHSEIMEVVLGEVKKSRRFFIDSRSSEKSVAIKTAGQLAVPSGSAWGIVDTDDNQERIAAVLDQASFTALEEGPVIVIAHARPNTLAVLEDRMQLLALRGIQFVHASSLVTQGKEKR
jgi:polysaccharide deacetylase 2 family uncharacterized protein YibQ